MVGKGLSIHAINAYACIDTNNMLVVVHINETQSHGMQHENGFEFPRK